MRYLKRTRSLALLAAISFSTQAFAACDPQEVGYVASFQVKPGSEAAFEVAARKLADTVLAVEQGVILYAPYRGNEGKYFMMERYSNEEARAAHGKAPEVAALFPSLGEHLAGAPDVQPVSAVCASE